MWEAHAWKLNSLMLGWFSRVISWLGQVMSESWVTRETLCLEFLKNVFLITLPTLNMPTLLGLVSLNFIVWCYVWLNVVVNKVILLLSKIMVTWIFGHYHIVHEMHIMWFMWFSHRRYKLQVLCKLEILVCSRWWNWAFHLRRL